MSPTPDDPPPPEVLRLYDCHACHLLAFLRPRVPAGVDAEDVAQELWRRVHQILGRERVIPGNPRAYLFEAARNLLRDLARTKRPQPLPAGYDAPQSDRSPLDALGDVEYARRVADCVGRLADPLAEVVRRRSEGEKPAAIAASLGVDADQVYKRLFNARRSLEECLGVSREAP